ncbi:hypothetical protein GCM10010172_30660 [Paractinoplanes ferrugineus]|uniref:Uncharacterized protein n=1 Tax=Paractinoplanes ferrugineus TaxID=113564 RepID=A0A919J6I5_9ACTN|nr:hypothetical protein [Actinoplanes ferrugineus]GIE14242.1 hypothetical protein Afe05nite_60820 [Actinoplanes ferrugineus]
MASAQLTDDSDDSLPGHSGGEPADDGFDDLRDMLGVASISDRLRNHLNTDAARLGDDPDASQVPPTEYPARPRLA